MNAVAILKAGMVTPVGFSAPAACAAMRAAIDAFKETAFLFDGELLACAQVPFAEGWRGREKLLRMAESAVNECIREFPIESLTKVPLLLCLAEGDRPGRLSGLDETLLTDIARRLQVRFAPESTVLTGGRMGGVKAIEMAGQLLSGGAPACLVAGVDSLICGPTLEAYHQVRRVKTITNSNGFIPGEAAAVVLLGRTHGSTGSQLTCAGVGYGLEPAPIMSEKPLRAAGLKDAITNAFKDAAASWADIDYRITDANGEQYSFKEASLAMTRTMRIRKETMELWHPADCIGEIGAAAVPCVLGVAHFAASKGYAPGPGVLCHFAADTEERGALVLRVPEAPTPVGGARERRRPAVTSA